MNNCLDDETHVQLLKKYRQLTNHVGPMHAPLITVVAHDALRPVVPVNQAETLERAGCTTSRIDKMNGIDIIVNMFSKYT